MSLKLVGIKDFRKNLAKYVQQTQTQGVRIIVLRKNMPLFEVKPVEEKEIAIAKLEQEVAEAREQIKRGEYITHEEMLKKLGLSD
ncbi:MAG: hypothetical protein AAB953_02180 [Patescibacteria group bacterium]